MGQIHQDIGDISWSNNEPPAINDTHLNDIETAILEALKGSNYILKHESDLQKIYNNVDELIDASDLIAKFDTATPAVGNNNLTNASHEIIIANLEKLLEKLSFDYSDADNPEVSIDSEQIATRDWVTANTNSLAYNHQSSSYITSAVDDGITCVKAVIDLTGNSSPISAISINISENGDLGPNFFNSDTFDTVVITLEQTQIPSGVIVGKIEGYNAHGADYRSMDMSMSGEFMDRFNVTILNTSLQAITPTGVQIYYGSPGPVEPLLQFGLLSNEDI